MTTSQKTHFWISRVARRRYFPFSLLSNPLREKIEEGKDSLAMRYVCGKNGTIQVLQVQRQAEKVNFPTEICAGFLSLRHSLNKAVLKCPFLLGY